MYRNATEAVNVLATAVVVPQRSVSTNLINKSAGQTGQTGQSVLSEFRNNSNLAAPNTTANNVSLTGVAYQNGNVRIYNYPCTSQHVS